ncbi:MAG: RdgB/HAM1 family non-canonical purine NTP pyrophosphatase [Puniceicoccales bacterium]|jgi:XTP/dITP diphosphohydrolase|nr:RdgB/HAM1 family non-canonical purine NTP pyrophosphatase [Puniceicoccales bacterium]
MRVRNLFIATKNFGKISEFKRMLLPSGLKILSIGDGEVLDVEETGETFLENARIKAEAAKFFVNDATVVVGDDSGLCVAAMGGRPGIHSARYANGDFASAMDRILFDLQGMDRQNRGACNFCALHAIGPNLSGAFRGEVHGTIAQFRRGNGMGYDPIFIPDGEERTFGEMAGEEKDRISHRGAAVRKLLNHLLRDS